MAAVLLAGAPLCNEVFAQTPSVIATTDPVYGNTNLKNGLKFVLSNGSRYVNAVKAAGADYVESVTTPSSLANATVFEIRSYSNKTFQLWTSEGQFKWAGYTTFYVTDGTSPVETADFAQIFGQGVGAGTLLSSFTARFLSASYSNTDLNANLSNKGFKLSFPGLTVAPDVNLFGNQLVAINATAISALNSSFTARAGELMFALADEAGLKLMNDASDPDNWKAATFVVLNPNKNFGITGLKADEGEGFDFTTIKGSKLAASNKKADGNIAYLNGVYTVAEDDQLNAEDELTLAIASAKVVKGTNENQGVSNLNVGVYSLTAGGLKSYVTTAKTNASKLVKASTAGNTYVAAADLLKAEAPAVYNIFFPGKAASGETSSYKGKYLVAEGVNTLADTAAVAPAYVATSHISAQWVVTDVKSKGQVELTNMGNKKKVTMKLYKTDNAGEYQSTLVGASAATTGTEVVKLIPATENGSFLNLTDAQKKQAAKISFNGVGNVTVKEIYMGVDKNKSVYPTSKEIANTAWYLSDKDINPIEHINAYAYLKGSEVKTDGKDTLLVQPYHLTYADDTDYALSWTAVSGTHISTTAADMLPYVFQQNANGTYTMWNVQPTGAYALYVETSAALGAEFTGNVNIPNGQYSTVTVDLKTLGESLEAVSRHATLEAENGGVSMQLNANGIYEGIIAGEPLTFWLDTADTDADVPSFYISKGIPADDEEVATKAADEVKARMFLYSPADSAYYWDANKATYVTEDNYYMPYSATELKAIFRPAALVGVDTLATVKGDKEVLVSKKAKAGVCEAGIESYKFNIVMPEGADAYYVVNAAGNYLFNLNGVLGFTADEKMALAIAVGEGDATANEAIAAEAGVQVIGGQGVVTVQGAAGKVITVANILGQTIANQVAASDNVTIAAPAGVVVVAVDGEATKVIVK